MKKWRSCFLMTILLISPLPLLEVGAVGVEELHSYSAILMDADTGQVLYDKNMHELVYPASTTKIMTGLLVSERATPHQVMAVSASALDIDEPDSANMDLKVGEELTVGDGLYGLMLPSANDAANALAEHVSGSQEAFVELMNRTAAEMGAENTHFANPHGLHEDNHYSTAYDIALITRYAIQNERFMQYFGAAEHTVAPTNLSEKREFVNYQSMLVEDSAYYYPAVTAGKIGFTDEARHTMSTVARRGGRTLICVVMYSEERQQKFEDTKLLLDFGFEEFQPVTIPKEEFSGFSIPITQDGEQVGTAAFTADRDFYALVHRSVDPQDIRIIVDTPESVKGEGGMTCQAAFAVETPLTTVPDLLGTQPLLTEIALEETAFVPAGPIDRPSGADPGFWQRVITDQWFYIALAGAVFLLIWLVFTVQNFGARRRQARLQMARIEARNRQLREEELAERTRREQQRAWSAVASRGGDNRGWRTGGYDQ